MIEATITGHEAVTLDGETWTGPSAEGDCARALIGRGVEPATPLVFARNGVPALRGTVEAFASRAWGGAGIDPQSRQWQPHPQGRYAPLLLAWHAERSTKRPRGVGGGGTDDCLVLSGQPGATERVARGTGADLEA